MDGFGDNFDETEVDPAAEFLAREQDQLAGLEDELKPAVTSVTNAAEVPVVGGSTDSAGGSFEMINSIGQSDMGFDPLSSGTNADGLPDELGEGGAEPLDFAPLQSNDFERDIFPSAVSAAAVAPSRPMVREEPEKIKKWREDQKQQLEEKDANEEKKKDEWREAAKKELEEWYRHHEDLIAKTKAANRNAEKQFVAEADAIEPGTEWERIAKLCDFNPKSSRTSKDVSRMRSIILQLKQSPPAAKQG